MYIKKNKQSQYGSLKLVNYIYINASGTYAEDTDGTELKIQTDASGNKFVEDFRKEYVDELVIIGFSKKLKHKDDEGYYIEHIDGDKDNCEVSNLRWIEVDKNKDTTANTVYFDDMIVRKDATLYVGKEKEKAMVKDHILDTDLDRVWVYETPQGMTFETDPSGPELWNIEEWMGKAGFVKGDKSSFKKPVVLHIDKDAANLNAYNLVWTEEDDARYIEYSKIRKERQIDLIEKYNVGYSIPDSWPHK